jgi:glutamate-1-semialdehyde 2,1-aminomutase
MEPAARMFISSTYWSDTFGLAAAIAILREVASRDVPAHCRELGQRLKSGLAGVAAKTGAPVSCGGVDWQPHLQFHVEHDSLKTKLATLYVQEMAKRGCHGYPSFYLNAAQGDAEAEQTMAAAEETFTLMAQGLDRSTVDDLLECELQQDAFRRIVR